MAKWSHSNPTHEVISIDDDDGVYLAFATVWHLHRVQSRCRGIKALNTLGTRQKDRDFADDILKCIMFKSVIP